MESTPLEQLLEKEKAYQTYKKHQWGLSVFIK